MLGKGGKASDARLKAGKRKKRGEGLRKDWEREGKRVTQGWRPEGKGFGGGEGIWGGYLSKNPCNLTSFHTIKFVNIPSHEHSKSQKAKKNPSVQHSNERSIICIIKSYIKNSLRFTQPYTIPTCYTEEEGTEARE